jgi:hypothetical protein
LDLSYLILAQCLVPSYILVRNLDPWLYNHFSLLYQVAIIASLITLVDYTFCRKAYLLTSV